MNIQPITISEFRKNTKVILDLTVDRDIYISRGWEVFKLQRVSDSILTLLPELKEKIDTQPTATVKAKVPNIPGLITAAGLTEPECSRHHIAKSKCLDRH